MKQLFVLRMAATHIIAQEAYNAEMNNMMKGNSCIDLIVQDIRKELAWFQAEAEAGRLKSSKPGEEVEKIRIIVPDGKIIR